MSRSIRKTPIFGIASAASEKLDKQLWHGRKRARERLEDKKVDLEASMPVDERVVSNVWSMAKDGRRYWPLSKQKAFAARKAQAQGWTVEERRSLQDRLLHKWQSK